MYLVSIDDIRIYCANEGVRYIRNSLKDRDVLTLSSLEERKSNAPRRAYKLYTSIRYNVVLHIMLLMHISLWFFKPDTSEDLKK